MRLEGLIRVDFVRMCLFVFIYCAVDSSAYVNLNGSMISEE